MSQQKEVSAMEKVESENEKPPSPIEMLMGKAVDYNAREIGSNDKMTPKRYFETADTILANEKRWKKEFKKVKGEQKQLLAIHQNWQSSCKLDKA